MPVATARSRIARRQVKKVARVTTTSTPAASVPTLPLLFDDGPDAPPPNQSAPPPMSTSALRSAQVVAATSTARSSTVSATPDSSSDTLATLPATTTAATTSSTTTGLPGNATALQSGNGSTGIIITSVLCGVIILLLLLAFMSFIVVLCARRRHRHRKRQRTSVFLQSGKDGDGRGSASSIVSAAERRHNATDATMVNAGTSPYLPVASLPPVAQSTTALHQHRALLDRPAMYDPYVELRAISRPPTTANAPSTPSPPQSAHTVGGHPLGSVDSRRRGTLQAQGLDALSPIYRHTSPPNQRQRSTPTFSGASLSPPQSNKSPQSPGGSSIADFPEFETVSKWRGSIGQALDLYSLTVDALVTALSLHPAMRWDSPAWVSEFCRLYAQQQHDIMANASQTKQPLSHHLFVAILETNDYQTFPPSLSAAVTAMQPNTAPASYGKAVLAGFLRHALLRQVQLLVFDAMEEATADNGQPVQAEHRLFQRMYSEILSSADSSSVHTQTRLPSTLFPEVVWKARNVMTASTATLLRRADLALRSPLTLARMSQANPSPATPPLSPDLQKLVNALINHSVYLYVYVKSQHPALYLYVPPCGAHFQEKWMHDHADSTTSTTPTHPTSVLATLLPGVCYFVRNRATTDHDQAATRRIGIVEAVNAPPGEIIPISVVRSRVLNE